jgi:DNA-directed RNA polymerase subunit RPC12/RpoP
MWVGLVFGILVLAFFYIYNKFIALRCPKCGFKSFHTIDVLEENKMKESYRHMLESGFLKTLDHAGLADGLRPGFLNRNFICKRCQEKFSRHIALLFSESAKVVGEKRALDDYSSSRQT